MEEERQKPIRMRPYYPDTNSHKALMRTRQNLYYKCKSLQIGSKQSPAAYKKLLFAMINGIYPKNAKLFLHLKTIGFNTG